MTLLLLVFLVPFNYFMFKDAWASGASVYAKGNADAGQVIGSAYAKIKIIPSLIVGVFDYVLLWSSGALALLLIRAIRFGKGRLKWSVFPIAPGSEVVLNFALPRSISSFEEAVVDLRCIKEFFEVRGTGKGSNRTLVHEQIWGDNRTASATVYDKLGGNLSVKFRIPASAESTALAAEMPLFWRALASAAAR